MARKKIIAGNWKMNMTPSQAVELCNTLKDLVKSDDVDVVYCVPAIDIIPVAEAVKGTNIQVGAENMYFEESGAYTGEISPAMLTDAGVKYVVLGHSERREYFAETDETVNKKVLKAFEHGITPIVCCGETLAQREQGVTIDFVRQQIKIAFQGVSADQAKTAVIAYEPIWSIGPGKTPAGRHHGGTAGELPHDALCRGETLPGKTGKDSPVCHIQAQRHGRLGTVLRDIRNAHTRVHLQRR